jgi:hypothetical protein
MGAAAAALVIAVLPIAAHAQATHRTVCNDGSTTSIVGANVCNGHGGINKGKTAVINRAPGKHTEPARVAQAGTPASAKPRYEERRGWRWARRHEEHKREEKHPRVRCRDGRWESAQGKGKDVCKHHGGVAH